MKILFTLIYFVFGFCLLQAKSVPENKWFKAECTIGKVIFEVKIERKTYSGNEPVILSASLTNHSLQNISMIAFADPFENTKLILHDRQKKQDLLSSFNRAFSSFIFKTIPPQASYRWQLDLKKYYQLLPDTDYELSIAGQFQTSDAKTINFTIKNLMFKLN